MRKDANQEGSTSEGTAILDLDESKGLSARNAAVIPVAGSPRIDGEENTARTIFSELAEFADQTRELLRKGLVTDNLKTVNSLKEKVQDCWNQFPSGDTLSREDLLQVMRAEIMLYACLDDHLDQVSVELSNVIRVRGEWLEKHIEIEVREFVTSDSRQPDQCLRLIKHKLAFLLVHANEFYRRDEISKSLQIVERLHAHTLSLRKHGYNVDGLMARVCVQQAKSFRQMMEYQRSRQFYSEALEAYLSATQKNPAEYTYYLHRVAMIIAGGSGFINLRRGLLTRAILGIRSARMMLLQSENIVYKMYLLTLSAGILRAQSGYDAEGLSAARVQLENAYQCLNNIGHFRYMLLAVNELVLTCIFLKDFTAAEKYVEEMRRLARGEKADGAKRNVRMTDNFRWLITADILTSMIRLHQRRLLDTRDIAKRAGEDARRRHLKRSHILALMLEGQALFEIGEYEDSREKFLKARDYNREERRLTSDPHLLVATLLYLCRIAVKTNNQKVAKSHFDESQSYGRMEHRWVEDLRIQAEKELAQLEHTFVIEEIPADGYHEAVERMRFWLFKEAQRKRGPNLTQIADELKLARSALYKWFEDPAQMLNEDEFRRQKS